MTHLLAMFFNFKKVSSLSSVLLHRFQEITGGMDGESVHRIFFITGHKYDGQVRLQFFQLFCQKDTVGIA